MRTVVNVKSGGSTRLSGMLHALILAAILLGLGRYASVVPMAVLAAILIKVGIDIVDYRFIKIVRQAPRHDLVVMITVLLLTVFCRSDHGRRGWGHSGFSAVDHQGDKSGAFYGQ